MKGALRAISFLAAMGGVGCRQSTVTNAGPTLVVAFADGGGQVALDAGIDFGTTPVFFPVEIALGIENIGGSTLTVDAFAVGPDGGPFSIVGTQSSSVAPGSSQPLVLQFLPAAQQAYAGLLTFTSDDKTQTSFAASLRGTG